MFDKINAKNLYLIELDTVIKYQDIDSLTTRVYYANKPRYTIAKKISCYYEDILTGTKYSDIDDVGREMVVRANALITSKKHLNKKDILLILQELNPTYLEAEVSRVRKIGKKNR